MTAEFDVTYFLSIPPAAGSRNDCVTTSCLLGAVSQHDSQLYEGCARVPLHGALLFSA